MILLDLFLIFIQLHKWLASLIAQWIKNLPAMQEIRVRSLGWEIPWRRKWQPTPLFLPEESQGWGSLVGCRLWGHTELDTTEVT